MDIPYVTKYLGGEYNLLVYVAGIEALTLFLARFIRENERVIGVMIMLAVLANYIAYMLTLALGVVCFGVSAGAAQAVGMPLALVKFVGYVQSLGFVWPLKQFVLARGMAPEAAHAVVMGWSRIYFAIYMLLGMAVKWPIVACAMPKGKRLEVWKAVLIAGLASYGFLFFTLTSRDIGIKP